MATVGLIVFVLVVALDVVALLLDLLLVAGGFSTITAFVRRNPWAGVAALAVQAAGALGLAAHFYPPW